jgi:hypothetical protein
VLSRLLYNISRLLLLHCLFCCVFVVPRLLCNISRLLLLHFLACDCFGGVVSCLLYNISLLLCCLLSFVFCCIRGVMARLSLLCHVLTVCSFSIDHVSVCAGAHVHSLYFSVTSSCQWRRSRRQSAASNWRSATVPRAELVDGSYSRSGSLQYAKNKETCKTKQTKGFLESTCGVACPGNCSGRGVCHKYDSLCDCRSEA